MAARLILRTSRLLAAPVSFQPSSYSAPSEVMRLSQLPPPFPCQAALHTSPLCRLAESVLDLWQNPATPETLKFSLLLQGMSGEEELLQLSNDRTISRNNAVLVIQHLSRREIKNKQALLNDQRFQKLLKTINSEIQDIWNSRLIVLLKSLQMLGFDSNNSYLKSVEVELQWRLRKLSIGALAQLSSCIVPNFQSEEERSLCDDLVKQVELRWTEIKETRTLVVLATRLGFMSNSLMERLEDKVLELAASLTPGESRRIIGALAAQNRRTLPVLRALSYHLVQNKLELTTAIITDLAFAYAKLNFCQPQVLQKMATDIIPKLPVLKPSNIALIARAFASLKFANQPLCEAIAQACMDNNGEFITSHLCSILHSFAMLNFQPSQNEEFFSMIHKRVFSEFDSLSWQVQMDVVWALCVLGHVTTPYLQKVLEPNFYSQILEISGKSTSYCVRLMHINTTAQLESPAYQGPLLSNDVLQILQERIKFKTSKLITEVTDALKTLYPDTGTCDSNVTTVYGWQLAAEVVLNPRYEALALPDFVAPHHLQSSGTKSLPDGAKRLAFISWEFPQFTFRGKDLLGRSAMCLRHLRAAGFLVVEVPYYEWQELQSGWQKQIFLKDQIKKVMEEEMVQ